jgi:hypothetical protein
MLNIMLNKLNFNYKKKYEGTHLNFRNNHHCININYSLDTYLKFSHMMYNSNHFIHMLNMNLSILKNLHEKILEH